MSLKLKAGDIITYSKKYQESWKKECEGYEEDFPKWAARMFKIKSIDVNGLIVADTVACVPGDNLPATNCFYNDGASYELAGPRRNHALTKMFTFEEKS